MNYITLILLILMGSTGTSIHAMNTHNPQKTYERDHRSILFNSAFMIGFFAIFAWGGFTHTCSMHDVAQCYIPVLCSFIAALSVLRLTSEYYNPTPDSPEGSRSSAMYHREIRLADDLVTAPAFA